jgi:hypothetical protein
MKVQFGMRAYSPQRRRLSTTRGSARDWAFSLGFSAHAELLQLSSKHPAITEIAERGVGDETIMNIATTSLAKC